MTMLKIFPTPLCDRIIIENKFQPPANEKPDNYQLRSVNQSDMHQIYNWPFLTTKNAKLIMLQSKINHKVIYTKDNSQKN